jgi:hypothetical protein
MSRPLLSIAALLGLAIPLRAQDPGAPEGWSYRLDGAQRVATGDTVASGEWRYQPMPPGWHVTTSDEGVLLFPREVTLTGRWGIEVELFLFPNPSDEGLGIVLEEEGGENQVCFLMRRDGQAALMARHGDEPMIARPWTSDTTAVAHDTTGIIKYVLRLVHESGHLAFSINGHEMFAEPAPGHDHVVVPGLRVGAGLNVHVSRYDLITPLAPPRPRGGGG